MIVESDHVNETSWNDALRNAGDDGTIFQSTFWGEYARKVLGDHPIYLSSTDKKGNINGLLLTIQSCYGNFPTSILQGTRGMITRELYKIALKKVFDTMLQCVAWQNGPVVLQQSLLENHSLDKIYRDLIEKILNIAGARNFYSIKFARPPYFMDRTDLMSSYGFEKRRMGTILVNVARPVESMWGSIDRIARRNITKTERDITFAEVTRLSELEDFYRMHVQSTRRMKAPSYPFSHYESLWNFFYPIGKIVAFTAFFEDTPIGASILLLHNGMIHEYSYADSDFARSNRIYAVDALKWHIMEWAHDRSLRYFDLSGAYFYKIDAGDEKARSLYRFKSKWGGKVIEFYDYKKAFRAKYTKILALFLQEGEGCHT